MLRLLRQWLDARRELDALRAELAAERGVQAGDAGRPLPTRDATRHRLAEALTRRHALPPP